MSYLRAFLGVCIDEDEKWAKWAQTVIAGTWDCWEVVAQQAWSLCDTVPNIGRIGSHLQYNADPARVLRDVAAKRRVLERHRPAWADDPSCYGCGLGNDGERLVQNVVDCPELRDMASIYIDRRGYDPTWREPLPD